MIARTSSGKRADGANGSAEVDAFLDQLQHPAKDLVVQLRRAVLAADAQIGEGIKWTVPSFRTSDYFATMHLRAKQGVGLILHFGAKKNAISEHGVTIADPAGLLQWLAKDRAMLVFADLPQFEAQRLALQDLLRDWIGRMV